MTTNKTLLETLMKIKEMLLNLQSISPEADNCYYKDECGKNCTPKKEQRTKMKKDYKEVKLDFQTHIENPCMWEELEKIISIVEQALAPQEQQKTFTVEKIKEIINNYFIKEDDEAFYQVKDCREYLLAEFEKEVE